MTISQVATDYSRAVQPIFEQRPHAGSIHSVFHRAVNVAIDGTMLALLSSELPHMPNGVRLPSTVMEELVQGLRVGMEVWVGEGRLLIPDCDISLYLPKEQLWEPRPDIEGYRWQRETVAQHMWLLACYLADRPEKVGFSGVGFWECLYSSPALSGEDMSYNPDHGHTCPPDRIPQWSLHRSTPPPPLRIERPGQEMPLARMALPRLRLLERTAREQDIAGVEEATRGLAGLGPGLTPAGDDVLAGFAAVMALLSARISADGTSRSHVAEVIAAVARPRTTVLSGVLLEYAARGEVAEQLGEMLLALALPAGESEAVLQAADKLLDFGGTSGGDTLLGVLFGLRALEGKYGDDLHIERDI